MPESAQILDIGCGAGQCLIATYNDRLCFGLDVDLEALKLGRSLTDQVCFINGSAEALPFDDGCFDLVFARVSLPYTNIPVSIKEIRRVLKRGGLFWTTLHPFSVAWEQVKKSNLKGKVYFAYILLNSGLLHCFQRETRFLGRRYETFQTQNSIRRILERNGFEAISIQKGNHFLVSARAK